MDWDMPIKVLVIAAHPDDETLGLGGTIASHSSKGDIVHVQIITDGSSTQYPNRAIEMIERKKGEAECAMRLLGVENIEFGELPDMRLDCTPHIVINRLIEEKVRDFEPEIIYTHHTGDLNMDHRMVARSTMVASRPSSNGPIREILAYEVPSSTEWNGPHVTDLFVPNRFVDISNFLELKMKAIDCYESELRDFPHPRCPEVIRNYDQANGNSMGMKYAERFMILRSIWK